MADFLFLKIVRPAFDCEAQLNGHGLAMPQFLHSLPDLLLQRFELTVHVYYDGLVIHKRLIDIGSFQIYINF